MDIEGIQGLNAVPGVSGRTSAGEAAGRRAMDIEDRKLLDACREFESFFVYMMLKEMRKTVPETKLFHGGRAEEIFRDMLDEETSKDIAKSSNGGIGIAAMMYAQLKRPTTI